MNPKTKVELTAEREAVVTKMDELQILKETEKRSFTSEEATRMTEMLYEVEEIDMLIKAAEAREKRTGSPIIIPGREKRKVADTFSLIKAINDRLENRQASDVERELFTAGSQEFRRAGVSSAGSIVIPTIVPEGINMRAAILAQTATAGQEIVAEDKKAILPPLVDKLIFAQAGVTYLTGLVGNVSIPSYAGTTVAWKSEVAAADDGGGAFSEVELAPKRLTAYILVSKLFLAQDGVGAERLLLDNIANAVARKLESTILGTATVSATQPSGIGYKLNVANDGGVAVIAGIDFDDLVALETAVDTANALAGNLAYITNSKGRGLLKGAQKFPLAASGESLAENNIVNGYPLLVTNSVPADAGAAGDGNAIYFGNWADLVIGQWGGYDITVDPYSKAGNNQVVITINAYFDAKGLRGKTGATTTLDEYAKSFAAASFKSA